MLVLVAHNDRWTRHQVREVLTHAGSTVIEASNGMSALRQAQRSQPDLVLLGPSLSEIDAGEVLTLLASAVHPGVTTGDLDALAEKTIRDAGAVPAFKGYHGYPATICASVNDEVIHGIPSGRRMLDEGDIAAPTMMRSAPIVADQTVLGHLEVRSSARPLWWTDAPGGATHFTASWREPYLASAASHSRRCSSTVRYPDTIVRRGDAIPARSAAAFMRVYAA